MRGSLLTLTIVNLSWRAMEVSIQVTAVVWPYGEAHHSRGSGKPSHRDWLLVPVVPATGTNGRCLEEVAIKMLKLDHHSSEAANAENGGPAGGRAVTAIENPRRQYGG